MEKDFNPVALARKAAEEHLAPAHRPDDWEARWQAVTHYVEQLIRGEPAALAISEDQRVAIAKMDYQQHLQEIPQRLQFQQDLALGALKGLTLVNGGAIVGLLTFIGNSATPFDQHDLGVGLVSFVIGLTANLLAYVFGYFSQATFMEATIHELWNDQRDMVGVPRDDQPAKYVRIGGQVLWGAILTALTSLASFACGATVVAKSFFAG